MEQISFCELIAIKESYYTLLVFLDKDTGKYIMCTKLPNWQTSEVSIGDTGFLKYQIVSAGEEFFDPASQTFKKYNYSNSYFLNFIKKIDIKNTNIIL